MLDLRPYWVNTYSSDRRFGGREEGGWWYDTGEPVASRFGGFLFTAKLIARLELAAARAYNILNGLHDPSSVLSEGEWRVVYIERHRARPFPAERPRYE